MSETHTATAHLDTFARDNLPPPSEIAPHKYPRHIEFVEHLPRTATGKLQHYRLRAREQR